MSENLGALQAEMQAGFRSVLAEIALLKADVSDLKADTSAIRAAIEVIAENHLAPAHQTEVRRRLARVG